MNVTTFRAQAIARRRGPLPPNLPLKAFQVRNSTRFTVEWNEGMDKNGNYCIVEGYIGTNVRPSHLVPYWGWKVGNTTLLDLSRQK